jgi:hypothetical protein
MQIFKPRAAKKHKYTSRHANLSCLGAENKRSSATMGRTARGMSLAADVTAALLNGVNLNLKLTLLTLLSALKQCPHAVHSMLAEHTLAPGTEHQTC